MELARCFYMLLEFNCGILELFQQSGHCVGRADDDAENLLAAAFELEQYGTIVYTWPSSRMQVVQL